MTLINAAVVTSFDRPPRYQRFELPEPPEGTIVVDVLAAGLHPRVRSGASGRHYTSTGTLPMVPGIDGVGRRADGTLVYFAADDDVVGTMATQAVVDPRRTVELPADIDIAAIAAGMNPAMSSWVALRKRAPLQPGQRVLVLGATGNAGTMAVRIAKLLGAGEVIGAGRDRARLDALAAAGADATVQLTDDADATAERLAVAADVDVVVDYLWGEPTTHALTALLTRRTDRGAPLDWIEIGSIAGPAITLPSVALRSANLRLLGAGQGSVSPREYVAQLPSLVAELDSGRIPVATRTAPLSAVEEVWTAPEEPGVRTVLAP